ncbi:hypothetical protein QUF75_18785 [Desulfococcaceae bacterium HSG7]|nr:hypothetical protein [Desulfococcaceae bacterium HSG7]
MKKMNEMAKSPVKDACKRLTGLERRAYQADIAIEYFDGSGYKAEREMGWGRECVTKGLDEARSGIRCADNYQGQGGKRTEDWIPNLREGIISIVATSIRRDTLQIQGVSLIGEFVEFRGVGNSPILSITHSEMSGKSFLNNLSAAVVPSPLLRPKL